MLKGILLIDKPEGWTSFDAVNYIRRVVAGVENKKPKNTKVGHCGTLDPFATGLLILLVGKDYTKKAGQFSKLDKTYKTTARLGYTSSTGDTEGEISKVSDIIPSDIEINKVLQTFSGEIMQVPPSYSAVKVNGKRAYKLAREGKEVQIEPRMVNIKSLEIEGYAYPDIKLTASVSSGTYIRSLVQDIGENLGTGAYTAELKRISIGSYTVHDAVAPKLINENNIEQLLKTA